MKFILLILGGLLILLSILNMVKPNDGSDRIGSVGRVSSFNKYDFILFDFLSILLRPIISLFARLFFNNIGLLLIGIVLVIIGIKV